MKYSKSAEGASIGGVHERRRFIRYGPADVIDVEVGEDDVGHLCCTDAEGIEAVHELAHTDGRTKMAETEIDEHDPVACSAK